MQKEQTTQENKIITISDKINSYSNDELISMTKSVSPNWETLSINKAQETILNFYPDNSFSQVIDNLDEARKAIQRRSHAVLWEMLISDRGQTIIAKAKEYSIPYDEEAINLLELIDLIDEYELLLKEAEEYNIDWDISQYDPVALAQEIDYVKRCETESNNDLHKDYLESRI